MFTGSPVNYIDPTGEATFQNNSGEPVTIWGNPGPGRGSGPDQIPIVVPPGGRVDADNPANGVTDVDYIDKNGNGIRDPGEKVPGTDQIPSYEKGKDGKVKLNIPETAATAAGACLNLLLFTPR